MAEYTYKDIIIDSKDPRLEGAIGKECYFSDYPKMLLDDARNSLPEDTFRLKNIRKDLNCPFIDENGVSWPVIIIKKEENMDNKDIKANRRNLTKFGISSACGLCEKDIDLINILYKDFSCLFALCRLREDEFNSLTECLDRINDIIFGYYMDLNKTGEEKNG